MNLLSIAFEEKINLAPIIAAVIAAIIVIIGWFIIAFLNRRNEIARELRQYRIDILVLLQNVNVYYAKFLYSKENNESYWDLFEQNNDKLLLKLLAFGYAKEIALWKEMEKAFVILQGKMKLHQDYSEEFEKYNRSLNELRQLIYDNFRDELNVGKYQFQ